LIKKGVILIWEESYGSLVNANGMVRDLKDVLSRDITMIDTHCHLEQSDYSNDRERVIERCKNQLQAVVTSCSNPTHFNMTMQLVRQHKGFIFATTSVHPQYVKEFDEGKLRQYFDLIHTNKENIAAIGETGLDYNWIKESKWQERQKQLFEKFITLANQLSLPLVIHSRDATETVISILETYRIHSVQMHMFTKRSLLKRVIDNGWFISVNTLLLRSKNVKKIVRDCPLEQLMLETDSPWLGIDKNGKIKPKYIVRNEPIAVRLVAEKIAQIKKMTIETVDRQTTQNACAFFNFKV
jgi:TatD DNase family protein